MSIETLMRAAEAAGFATASGENEAALLGATFEPTVLVQAPVPADLLSRSRVQTKAFASIQEPLASWTRTQLAGFMPAWHAKV